MNKITNTILKNPFLMGIMTFLSAFILSIILKLFLGFESATIEKNLIPVAIAFPILYGYITKEEMSKSFRIKLSITTTLLYVILNLLIICNSPELYKSELSKMILTFTVIQCIINYFLIYHISGHLSKRASKYDLEKIIETQKNIPIEIQNKNKLISILFIAFMTLGIILMLLNDRQIIHLNKNIEILLPLSILGIIFFTGIYLKKTQIK